MPTVLPMTRVEAYLAYKAGVISESELKPSLKTNFYSGLENWLAYWCGLTADYPKDENNDPKWYTEEEYYVAYLCGIAPDYPVNCYRRVGAYLRYIISARWDRPEKPLTREEYYLSLMSTTYLPPNDPASVISLDGTAEAPFKDLKIYGDTFQQTYSGKNLWGGFTGTYSSAQGFQTMWLKDGSITITGPAIANGWSDITSSALPASRYVSLPAGTYTFYFSSNANRAQIVSVRPDGTGETAPIDITSSSGEQSFTLNETRCIYPRIGVTENDSSLYAYFMIVAGSTAGDYEPYTGSTPTQLQPSPNPDYPQDIQVVTGSQTVSVMGKNLFDGNLESGLINGSTGEDFAGADYMRSAGYVPVRPNTAYRILADNYPEGSNYFWYEYKADKTYNLTTNKTSLIGSFTTDEGTYFVRFRFVSGYKNTSSKIMLSEGSSDVTYEPYQGQSYTIDLGTIELCKIGTYQDYIWKDGADWKLHKEIESVHVKDKITWITNNDCFQTTAFAGKDADGVCICSHFTFNSRQSQITSYLQEGEFGFNTSNAPTFKYTAITTTTAWNQWLTDNDPTLYYHLATATDTAITEAALISQLDALLEGGSYAPQTNIVLTTAEPNLPGLLQVTAAKWQ